MKPQRKVGLTAGLVIVTLLITMLTPSPAEAHHDPYYYYNSYSYVATTPCPAYSLQDVLDDPTGDWDRDGAPNNVEFYNQLNPCTPDADKFCLNNPSKCLKKYNRDYYDTTSVCYRGKWSWADVKSDPHGDWDGDGISNRSEARAGASPCRTPCPNPTHADLALNPYGAWDGDGVYNAAEVRQGTNPCDGYSYNPCPNWAHYQVNFMPDMDWDRDSLTNSVEIAHGTNPCAANVVIPAYQPPPPPTVRLPHVTTYTTYVQVPVQVQQPTCPPGYPYYHPGNGQCYANPV